MQSKWQTQSNLTWNLIQLQSMIVKFFWINKSLLTFQPKLELNLKWIFSGGSKRSSYFQGVFSIICVFLSNFQFWIVVRSSSDTFPCKKACSCSYFWHIRNRFKESLGSLGKHLSFGILLQRQSSRPLSIPYCNAFTLSSAEENHLHFT